MVRAANKCVWLMRSRKENCGKSCVGAYCKQHNYQLKKGMKILSSSDILHTRIIQISEAIQNLPIEIREKIYKEFVAIKLRERKEMGWNEVLLEINEAPFCEKRLRITKVMFCRHCNFFGKKERRYECYKHRENHYLGYPIYDEDDYDEILKKFY